MKITRRFVCLVLAIAIVTLVALPGAKKNGACRISPQAPFS
jgi:hypothetical protein